MFSDGDQDLHMDLWEIYQKTAGRLGNSNIIEWSNFNSCINHFGEPITFCNSETTSSVVDLARTFVEYDILNLLKDKFLRTSRNFQETWSSIEIILEAPTFEYEYAEDTIAVTQVTRWNLDAWWYHALCVTCLKGLSGSKDPAKQLSFLREMDNPTQRKLRSTVFSSEAYVAYCQLLHISFYYQFPPSEKPHEALQGFWTPTPKSCFRSPPWRKYSFWAKVLMSSFCNSQVSNFLHFPFPSKKLILTLFFF